MNTARRDSWLVAAVVVVALVALVVVGRLQTGHLPEGDAGGSQPTKRTVRTDAPPVASGLAVAGRVALSGQVEAVAVGEDAVWVLLAQGTLLRVDPERHRVTGRLELGVPPGMTVGPLAVGAGAVWVGMRDATVTVRVDPVRLRVTGRLAGRVAAVARGVVWSYCCRRGDDFMGFGRVDAGTLRPRRPLVVTDAAGRRQPVGWLASAPGVWTVAFGFRHQRLWRVPLGGGPARPVARVDGLLYGLAADAGRVWVLSGSGDPGSQRDWTVRLRRLDQRSGEVTATTPLPELEVVAFQGPLGFAAGAGAVWVAGPDSGGLLGPGSCCGWIPPRGGWPGGCATRSGSSGCAGGRAARGMGGHSGAALLHVVAA